MTTFNNLFSKGKSHVIGLRVLSHVLLTVFLEVHMSRVLCVLFLGWSFCCYLASSKKLSFVCPVPLTCAFYQELVAHFNNPWLSCYMSYCLNTLDHTYLPHNRNLQRGKTKPKPCPPPRLHLVLFLGWMITSCKQQHGWVREQYSRGVPSGRTAALASRTLSVSS